MQAFSVCSCNSSGPTHKTKPALNAMNPFNRLIKEIPNHGKYYSLSALNDPRIDELPYTIKILLEGAIRCCDEFRIHKSNVEDILNWKETSKKETEIPFQPSRVLLQDFTGVPAAVDLAAMRDTMSSFNKNPDLINPLVPVDLVIDHSVQVDSSRCESALQENEDIEMKRNHERFAFLKWSASAFSNMLIVPPGSGIVHQVNLEHLARVVFCTNGLLYPDSVVGTDSHTTMIDGLGVTGWGVGGIEAEAVMLGQPISMILPEVIGFELTGTIPVGATATDLVLTVTQILRARGVVGKFVEFFGEGCKHLTVADRATISNMSPEYGATMGFFPVDEQTLVYLRQTGRPEEMIARVERYLKAQKLFRMYDESDKNIKYTDTIHLNLSNITPCVSGPKRPQDQVALTNLAKEFKQCLVNSLGFKGYNLSQADAKKTVNFSFKGTSYELKHGSVVIAAITSCTNTSNPNVMLGAGLLAKKAVELGLTVKPYIKTSLSPGSTTVLSYLNLSGLLPYLEKLNFYMTGFGCQTCIGNSGELDEEIAETIKKEQLVTAAVLSGNRNFEGRIHPLTRANYLMSPMLVLIYALAGSVDIDLTTEPVACTPDEKPVYLKDLWPTEEEISSTVQEYVLPSMFREAYQHIKEGGSQAWKNLSVPQSQMFPWSGDSTYIHNPPFFHNMKLEAETELQNINEAHCLLVLGDSVTTDHISPAGAIAKNSPAAIYLESRGITQKDYNTYGSRRGNDEIMARGTFANIRLINQMSKTPGPYTIHIPTQKELPIYDAAMQYKSDGKQLVILAGKEYGSGSSRDWAAKGPYLLGVRAVIAESYERIHRSNLVGMGVLPLQFVPSKTPKTLNLDGTELYSISLQTLKQPGQQVIVQIRRNSGNVESFETKCRIDTIVELEYFRNGGILHYVLRSLAKKN